MKSKYVTQFLWVFLSVSAFGQNAKDSILKNISVWNSSFNKRDTTNYYRLLDKDIAITAGGGTVNGVAIIKEITAGLFTDRPDIVMNLNSSKLEVSKQWMLAYDTGEWIENWTEKKETKKSEIKGKYWRMWKKYDDEWIIMSIILTPLSCTGSYCQ
jgi:hypothetical protein